MPVESGNLVTPPSAVTSKCLDSNYVIACFTSGQEAPGFLQSSDLLLLLAHHATPLALLAAIQASPQLRHAIMPLILTLYARRDATASVAATREADGNAITVCFEPSTPCDEAQEILSGLSHDVSKLVISGGSQRIRGQDVQLLQTIAQRVGSRLLVLGWVAAGLGPTGAAAALHSFSQLRKLVLNLEDPGEDQGMPAAPAPAPTILPAIASSATLRMLCLEDGRAASRPCLVLDMHSVAAAQQLTSLRIHGLRLANFS